MGKIKIIVNTTMSTVRLWCNITKERSEVRTRKNRMQARDITEDKKKSKNKNKI